MYKDSSLLGALIWVACTEILKNLLFYLSIFYILFHEKKIITFNRKNNLISSLKITIKFTEDTWIRIRIRNQKKCWIWIRIKINADSKPWPTQFLFERIWQKN
jgi:hypothetical protein